MVCPASEFRYNPGSRLVDKVEVYVENQDKRGQLVLSHKKARLRKLENIPARRWRTTEVIQRVTSNRTKGGMIVDVFGIEAFAEQPD